MILIFLCCWCSLFCSTVGGIDGALSGQEGIEWIGVLKFTGCLHSGALNGSGSDSGRDDEQYNWRVDE